MVDAALEVRGARLGGVCALGLLRGAVAHRERLLRGPRESEGLVGLGLRGGGRCDGRAIGVCQWAADRRFERNALRERRLCLLAECCGDSHGGGEFVRATLGVRGGGFRVRERSLDLGHRPTCRCEFISGAADSRGVRADALCDGVIVDLP